MRNKKSSGKAIFISTAVVLAVSAGCIFALHTVAARHTDNAGKSASIMTQEGKDIAAAGLLFPSSWPPQPPPAVFANVDSRQACDDVQVLLPS